MGILRGVIGAIERGSGKKTGGGLLSRAVADLPDAGRGGANNAWREQLRGEGFDVDTPLYHGSTVQAPIDTLRPSDDGLLGRGVYLTDSPKVASEFSYRDGDDTFGQVLPVFARGPFASSAEYRELAESVGPQRAIQELQAQGYRGVRGRWGKDGSSQIAIFDPGDVRSQWGRANAAPDGSGL